MKHTTLPNGVRVYTKKTQSDDIFVESLVLTGSMHETDKMAGMSHFLEHMSFKGTSNRTGREIMELVDKSGGNTNAFTSQEVTAYYINAPKEHLKMALDVTIDNLLNSVFNPTDIVMEHKVIVQEIKQYADNPWDIAWKNFVKQGYDSHSLSRPIIGYEETIQEFRTDDFKAYVKDNYTADNIIIFATGKNINHEEIVNYVSQFNFNPAAKRTKIHPPKWHSGYKYHDKPTEQNTFIMGWPAVPRKHKDNTIYDMLALYLSGGFISPLVNEIREKRGLVYGINASASENNVSGLFNISAGTTPANVMEVVQLSLAEMEKIATKCDPEHFQTALNKLRFAISKIQYNRMTAFWTHVFAGSTKKLMKQIESVTPDDLQRVAATLLETKPVISLVGPTTNEIDSYLTSLV